MIIFLFDNYRGKVSISVQNQIGRYSSGSTVGLHNIAFRQIYTCIEKISNSETDFRHSNIKKKFFCQ